MDKISWAMSLNSDIPEEREAIHSKLKCLAGQEIVERLLAGGDVHAYQLKFEDESQRVLLELSVIESIEVIARQRDSYREAYYRAEFAAARSRGESAEEAIRAADRAIQVVETLTT